MTDERSHQYVRVFQLSTAHAIQCLRKDHASFECQTSGHRPAFPGPGA